MTSSLTHHSLFFLAFPHPPLPAFFFALPCPRFSDPFRRFFRRFPTLFRRYSPPIRSQDPLRKIGSEVAHDVSLMSFLSIFWHENRYRVGRFSTTNQKPPFFRRFFRRFPKMLSTNQKPGNL